MRTCIVCQCTDSIACDGGCEWSEIYSKTTGLCSECPLPADPKKLEAKERERLRRLAKEVKRVAADRRQILRLLQRAEWKYGAALDKLREFHGVHA